MLYSTTQSGGEMSKSGLELVFYFRHLECKVDLYLFAYVAKVIITFSFLSQHTDPPLVNFLSLNTHDKG